MGSFLLSFAHAFHKFVLVCCVYFSASVCLYLLEIYEIDWKQQKNILIDVFVRIYFIIDSYRFLGYTVVVYLFIVFDGCVNWFTGVHSRILISIILITSTLDEQLSNEINVCETKIHCFILLICLSHDSIFIFLLIEFAQVDRTKKKIKTLIIQNVWIWFN